MRLGTLGFLKAPALNQTQSEPFPVLPTPHHLAWGCGFQAGLLESPPGCGSHSVAILVKGSGKEGTEKVEYEICVRPFQSFSFVPAALGVKFVCLVLQRGFHPPETPMKYTNVDSWKSSFRLWD